MPRSIDFGYFLNLTQIPRIGNLSLTELALMKQYNIYHTCFQIAPNLIHAFLK